MTPRRVAIVDDADVYVSPGEIVPSDCAGDDSWFDEYLDDEARHRLEGDAEKLYVRGWSVPQIALELDATEAEIQAAVTEDPDGYPGTPKGRGLSEMAAVAEWIYGLELDFESGGTPEDLGISARRLNPSDPEGSTCPRVRALPGDPAAEWLKANDPRLHAEGIADEIAEALESEELTLDEARAAFRKSGGKPTQALRALRGRVADALLPMWEDDRRRDYMAAALDCDRKTLRRLMANRPTVANK